MINDDNLKILYHKSEIKYNPYLSYIIRFSVISSLFFRYIIIYLSPDINKKVLDIKLKEFENTLHNNTEEEINEFRQFNSEKKTN